MELGCTYNGMGRIFKIDMKLLQDLNIKSVLDIGANIGEFSTEVKKLIPDCNCFMVEANAHCAPYLEKTGIPYDIATLSHTRGFVNFFIQPDNLIGTGASMYKENTEFYKDPIRQVVVTKRLDDCNYIQGPIDLIKLDTQGSELNILMGGLETVNRCKYILIETSLTVYNQGAPLIDGTFNLMNQLNFKTNTIFEYKYNENGIFQIDFLFEKQ